MLYASVKTNFKKCRALVGEPWAFTAMVRVAVPILFHAGGTTPCLLGISPDFTEKTKNMMSMMDHAYQPASSKTSTLAFKPP